MPRIRKGVPGVDTKLFIKDAAKLLPNPARRLFLRGAASLGAVTFLTGCDITDSDTADGALRAMSKFNDRVQALIFQPMTLDELYKLPEVTQITRHICVEGWSAIGKWSGAPLRGFLERIGADLTAKYVYFICAEGYSNTIDMPTALHPQTQMTFKFDGEILPRKYGFPIKIRMPTKLGFKNPKHVVAMAVLNEDRGGYWEDRGYNWFSGS